MQVGVAGAVLLPVPDRERRMAAELELDRPVVEDMRSVKRTRLEQQDREGGRGRKQETAQEDELLAGPSEGVRVRGPEGRNEQRREFRPAGERGEHPAGKRGAHEP